MEKVAERFSSVMDRSFTMTKRINFNNFFNRKMHWVRCWLDVRVDSVKKSVFSPVGVARKLPHFWKATGYKLLLLWFRHHLKITCSSWENLCSSPGLSVITAHLSSSVPPPRVQTVSNNFRISSVVPFALLSLCKLHLFHFVVFSSEPAALLPSVSFSSPPWISVSDAPRSSPPSEKYFLVSKLLRSQIHLSKLCICILFILSICAFVLSPTQYKCKDWDALKSDDACLNAGKSTALCSPTLSSSPLSCRI